MDAYGFVQLLLFLTGAAGLAGYMGLFVVCFRLLLTSYTEPIQWKRWYLLLALTAIIAPMVLVFVAIKVPTAFGFRFHSDELGIMAGDAAFPLLTLPLMFLMLWAARHIWRSEKTQSSFFGIPIPDSKQGLSQNEMQLVSCGCVLPLILFVVFGITLVSLGYKFHDYKPSFDGPQPEWIVQNMNLVKSVGRICLLSVFVGSMSFLLLAFPAPFGFKPERTPKAPNFIEWIVVIAIIGGLAALLLPAIKAAREVSRNAPGSSHLLRSLAFAMHAYHQQYESFPPAYTVDQEGKPLHSWRVLILPFCGNKNLYDKIRLDEPWDSEYNSRFHTATADFFPYYHFENPDKRIRRRFDFGHYSDYSVIVGPTTVFPDAASCTMSDIPHPDQTLLIVERSTPICWMEPMDEIKRDDFGVSVKDGSLVITCTEYAEPTTMAQGLSPDRLP